ncbi:Hsp70 chaperone protein [Fusarium bulbicola]|nr:Hsp70 chaperone protein [Fusarium bulbicola]
MATESDERKLIVGVDYGTTYSGVSFVWSTAVGIESIELIDRWGSGERTGGRVGYERLVPSKISYSPGLSWGYDIDPGAKTYCWTKLLLDRFTQTSDFDDSSLNEVEGPCLLLTPPDKTPEDVVTDFLTLLYSHVMSLLADKFGTLIELSPIEFWFTVPAIWSLRAEDATRNAALKAGFGSRAKDSVHMVREPEAAAIACLSELIKDGESKLVQVGDGVIVCDCGGGTVDLASYKVQVAYPKPSLDQACVNEGGKCGSTTIDRALHRLMVDRFGSAFSSLPYEKRGAGTKFMNQFESAKRDFGLSKRSRKYRLDLRLQVPNSQWYDGDDNEVIITTEDMKSLFDPLIKQIIALLEQQIQATMTEGKLEVKTICLVGGFGESVYLLNKLKEWCPPGIELLNPTRSWEAVCLGAALRGLDGPIVVKKKCRRHLGTKVAKPFREGIDDEDDSYVDPFDGSKRIGGFMDWMVNRGEVITPESVVIRPYSMNFPEGRERKWVQTLYQCSLAVAPEKQSHYSVEELGELHVDLSNVDLSDFETKELATPFQWRKLKIHKIVFLIVMVVEDNLGYMHFRVVCGGKIVGEAKLKFGKEEEEAKIALKNLTIS